MLFEPGLLCITPGAQELITDEECAAFLKRHLNGDWGDLWDDDKRVNELAVKEGNRILSSYTTAKGAIWIITEADRSATTILLPDEY